MMALQNTIMNNTQFIVVAVVLGSANLMQCCKNIENNMTPKSFGTEYLNDFFMNQ
jgi:hypothetical protein